MPSAQVFLSCGQRKNNDEIEVARAIATRLSQLGFAPYIAVGEQTLKGIKENIFTQLESSEYFVFIDFKREELDRSKEHRGSLFCHQELAIASYLDIEVLALQETGVRPLDGLLGFLQANVVSFTDRHLLASVVADEVNKRGWDSNWKNELELTRSESDRDDARNQFGVCRFFQINVRNHHRRKIAANCYAYLESVRDLATGAILAADTAEHKWRGYTFPNACIAPQSQRRFDAFYVPLDRPHELRLNWFTDFEGMAPGLVGRGPFELRYVVLSENFPLARKTLRLTLADTVDTIRLEAV